MRGIAALLFAFSWSPQAIGDPGEATEFRRIIAAHYYAISENRLGEAMSLYHQDSPQADEVRRQLEFGQFAYLQRTSTLSLDLVHHNGEHVIVRATHRHLRIVGIKFIEEFAETRYVLRRQGDVWKIWSSDSVAERPS
jgi:hypothetical protein